MITTIETRLKLDKEQESIIDSCSLLWSQYYRKTWVMLNNKQMLEKDIWHNLMNTKLFTSNQVDSLLNKVKTEHSKFKELTKTQLKKHQAKLDNVNKFVDKESKLIIKNDNSIIKLKENLIKINKDRNIDKDIVSSLMQTHSKISKLINSNKNKKFTIKQKTIKLSRLKRSINLLQKRIKKNTFKLCFGSSSLLKQRPGNHKDKFRLTSNQKPYKNLTDWQKDWEISRNNIIYSIGRKTKPQGNAEIQYYPESKVLRFRVTDKEYINRLELIAKNNNTAIDNLNDNNIVKNGIYRMQARFIEINDVNFCEKNLDKLKQVINTKPITAKIIKKLTPNGKEIGFYLQLSFEENVIEAVKLKDRPKTIGIDLNQKGLAYCIVKNDGNKLSNKEISKINSNHKTNGFISWDLEGKTSQQRKWIISNVISELLSIAQEYGVYSIAIENLDFSRPISSMNSGYKTKSSAKGFNLNAMLSGFAKTQFKELIIRKASRLGMTINMVNSSYSSVGGYTKYGILNKLSVDVSAALWLARQSIYGEQYKIEDNVKFIKKHNEAIIFPYSIRFKQSNKSNGNKIEWREIAFALGKNRTLWYKNSIINIEPIVDNVVNQSNPFE